MTSTSTYADKEILHQNLKGINDSLLEKYINSRTLLTDEFYQVSHNSLHFLSKLLNNKTPTEKIYFRLLAKTILQSENLSGGSSVVGFVFACYLLKVLLRIDTFTDSNNENISRKTQEDVLSVFKAAIEKNMTPASEQDLLANIQEICDNELLAEVIYQAVSSAGLEGKIYVEDGKQSSYVLEKKLGYVFDVKPIKAFLTEANSSLERQGVKILLIDGLIERVSEIDLVLTKAYQTKEPVVIVARGFSEEVVATLKVNFDKGFLNVIPVLLNSDLESINLLNDLAVVCGCQIVSTLNGEMLGTMSLDDLPTVQKIRCQLGQIVIEEPKTQGQVASQIKSLLSKRTDNQNVEDIVNLLDKRIKALTSNTVTIRLPNISNIEAQTARAKIDISLRTIKSFLGNGVVQLSDIARDIEANKVVRDSDFGRAFMSALTQTTRLFPQNLSTLSVLIGIVLMSKTILSIYTGSGVVITDPPPLLQED